VCIAVLLASENDHRPYDPFGDDDDVVTSSVPVVPISRTLTTATATLATATVRTLFCSSDYYI